jgi:putative membrane protein
MSDLSRVPPSDSSTRLAEHRTGLADLRSHLANERTHLAYLRTSISLMGFGITLNRFSIYLQQQSQLEPGAGPLLRDSASVGLGMVVLGVVLLGWALFRYRRVERQIRESGFTPSTAAVSVLTAAVIALGAVSALWLLTS